MKLENNTQCKTVLRKDTVNSEQAEQEIFLLWFRMQYKNVLIFHIPNGAGVGIKLGIKLKKTGVVPGIPDLHIPQWKLWIEMKRQQGGKVSNEQKDIIQHLESIGHEVIIGKGATDAIRKVMKFYEQNTI